MVEAIHTTQVAVFSQSSSRRHQAPPISETNEKIKNE
jgi:hypothetical protein